MGLVRSLVQSRTGMAVATGPFAGMKYVEDSANSAYVPKLLGIYERELAPIVERIIAGNYATVVDVGAAEGYYAVGLALRIPRAIVDAYELGERGRELLSEMARLNGVSDRLRVLGACDATTLASSLARGEPHVIICDVEGYERQLLDPAVIPKLATTAILVEIHEFAVRGVEKILLSRFKPSHRIERISSGERSLEDFPYRHGIRGFLLKKYMKRVVNEFRPEKMSWLWMTPLGDA
jgi:tRNA G37 N-methylase Trm5